MIHRITKEQYIKDPCGASSVAFWKSQTWDIPKNIKVSRNESYSHKTKQYFRLIHRLDSIQSIPNDTYDFVEVDINKDIEVVSFILEKCYGTKYLETTIKQWTNYPVYDAGLWLFVVDKKSKNVLALGIADYDLSIREGSLEWIQVLPEYRKRGIGELLINELLMRLKRKASFVTVSGSDLNAQKLYIKCGFTDNVILYVEEEEVTK